MYPVTFLQRRTVWQVDSEVDLSFGNGSSFLYGKGKYYE